jgi:hypothetical protein
MTLKAQIIKGKIDQLDIIKIKNLFFCFKRHHQESENVIRM